MKVTRNVVLDLLPLYVAGEASAETNLLVEEFLRQDPELRQEADRVRLDLSPTATIPDTRLPPDLELRSLRRTRRLLRWQRLAFGWALAFTCIALTTVISFEGGHVQYHLLLRTEHPQIFDACVGLGLSGWLHYFFVRYRLRLTKL